MQRPSKLSPSASLCELWVKAVEAKNVRFLPNSSFVEVDRKAQSRMNMANPRKCAACGASLRGDALDAICPMCAFRAALEAGSGPSERFNPASLFDPSL